MATIISSSDGNGYTLNANNMGYHSEYVYSSKADGNTKYGSTYNSFPRRNQVGNCWSESTGCGSRSGQAYNNTARTTMWFSKKITTISSGGNNTGYGIGGNGIGWHQEYIHHNTVDGSTKYGAAFGFPRRNLIGGGASDNTACGSRSFVSDSNTTRTMSWVSKDGNDL